MDLSISTYRFTHTHIKEAKVYIHMNRGTLIGLEFLLSLVPIGFWIAQVLLNRNSNALPIMYMHDVKSVRSKPLVLPADIDVVKRVSKDWNGWDSMKKRNVFEVKYASMCYGNREDFHLHMHDTSEFICNKDHNHPNVPWKLSYKHDEAGVASGWVRALLLEKWQYESQGTSISSFFGSRSFCTCMDHMHFMTTEKKNIDARRQKFKTDMLSFFANNSDAGIISYFQNHYFQVNSRDSAMYGDVSTITSQPDGNTDLTLRLTQIIDNMRSSNMELNVAGDLRDDIKERKAGSKADDILELSNEDSFNFCDKYSVPEHSVQFEGVMDSWKYIWLGQLLLLLSCTYALQIHCHQYAHTSTRTVDFQMNPPESVNPQMQGTGDLPKSPGKKEHSELSAFQSVVETFNMGWDGLFFFGRFVGSLVGILVVLVMSGNNDGLWHTKLYQKHSNAEELGLTSHFENPGKPDLKYFVMTTVLAGIIWFLEVFFLLLIFEHKKRNQSGVSGEEAKKKVVMEAVMNTRILFTLMHDIYVIAAFVLLSVGVMLQNNVQSHAVVFAISIVVGVAGLAQHISNMINIAFDLTTGQLLKDQRLYVNALENMKKGFAKRKALLLRICYIRSGIAAYVVISAVLCVTCIGVSKVGFGDGTLKSMLCVTFAIALVVILCGFDMFYELFYIRPAPSEKTESKSDSVMLDKRYLHILFVYIYITFANFLTLDLKA